MSGVKTPQRWIAIPVCCAALFAATVCALRAPAWGETDTAGPTDRDPIAISADFSQSWRNAGEAMLLLRGRCRIVQGTTTLSANKMVVWRRNEGTPAQPRERVTVYLEDEAVLEQPASTLTEPTLLLDMVTRGTITVNASQRITDQPATDDAVFQRALKRRGTTKPAPPPPSGGLFQQVQFRMGEPEPTPELRSVQLQAPAMGLRRIRVFPRSAVNFNVESFESKTTTPPEQVWVIRGGVNLLVDGVTQTQGTVDLSADSMVIWSQLGGDGDITGEKVQSSDMPLEVYLEGNIIIRQGGNVMYATQAFYDAREDKALLLNAHLKTTVPNFPIKFRVRAERLRQLSQDTYQAQRAWITTSEYGRPGYRLQSSDIFIEPRLDSWFGDGPQIDPETGEKIPSVTPWATTLNNTFLLNDVPLFYFPYLSFPAEDPNIPLRNITVENDRIFGWQVYTQWNMWKLLGINRPGDVTWNGHLDYLAKRGIEVGSTGNYRGNGRFGLDGSYIGSGAAFYIHDTGKDNLGTNRSALIPGTTNRGRVRIRDRQDLPYGMSLLSEFGYVSDRNYLEQFDEMEYDAGKDYESLMSLKQQQDNWSWSVMARPRLYNYFNESAWLPRGDFYWLGQQVFNTPLIFSTHGYIGYANQRIADKPTDPNDLYTVLPFEGNAQGLVAAKRAEVNLPFDVGPVHVVPYGLGEAAYWSADYSGQSLSRLYGSVGARGSLEFWKVFPTVQSDIFNLNGLAHKMVFDADYSMSQSTQDLSSVPQFNEFDDNAQEQFRRRLVVNTFNGTLPPTFAPQFYAVRSGAAHDVTSPYNELVDDQQVLRLGWRHRLQTKVGPVNAPRIKNWMTLDLETSYFPNAVRDNFGQDFGLYGGRYNWALGDRTNFLASAYFDTFDNAQHLWSLGLTSQRTTRGMLYLGLRQVQGAGFSSQIATASFNYTLSPKWTATLGTAYDLAANMNMGQNVTVTRVGADFLVHVGAMIDPLRNNYGFGVSVEPRFSSMLGTSANQMGGLLNGTNQNPTGRSGGGF